MGKSSMHPLLGDRQVLLVVNRWLDRPIHRNYLHLVTNHGPQQGVLYMVVYHGGCQAAREEERLLHQRAKQNWWKIDLGETPSRSAAIGKQASVYAHVHKYPVWAMCDDDCYFDPIANRWAHSLIRQNPDIGILGHADRWVQMWTYNNYYPNNRAMFKTVTSRPGFAVRYERAPWAGMGLRYHLTKATQATDCFRFTDVLFIEDILACFLLVDKGYQCWRQWGWKLRHTSNFGIAEGAKSLRYEKVQEYFDQMGDAFKTVQSLFPARTRTLKCLVKSHCRRVANLGGMGAEECDEFLYQIGVL